MTNFVFQLTQEVAVQLRALEKEGSPLCKAQQAILLFEEAFGRLKEFTISYVFKDETEEIHFFKNLKPKFFCDLIYYQKMYNLEMNRPTGGDNEQRKYLDDQLSHIKEFFDNNKAFYQYYRAKECYLDRYFFLRGKPTIPLNYDSFYFERDPLFSTAFDFKMARILANDKLETYINEELAGLDKSTHDNKKSIRLTSKVIWTGGKIDLIELLYGLYCSKSINCGNISLKQLVSYYESIFNIELMTTFSRAFYNMRIRQNPTSYIDKMRDSLRKRMDNDDKEPMIS